MEITFRNNREDLQAFYDYMVKETEQGKKLSRQAFRESQAVAFMASLLFGFFLWGATGQWKVGLAMVIVTLILGQVLNLLISGFRPVYYVGIRLYKNQEKSITQKDLQIYQLPRILVADDNWLEVRSSEAVHRWRWRRVEKIALTPNFIFIHVGNCPVVYVPKRDFQSEQSFIELGRYLVELKEKFKDQPIGAE